MLEKNSMNTSSTKYKILVSVVDYFKADSVLQLYHAFDGYHQMHDIFFSIVDNSCDVQNGESLIRLSGYGNVSITINDKNIGYTKATNQSISNGSCFEPDFIIIINPDVRLSHDFNLSFAIEKLMSHAEIGILGIRQINDDGSVAPVIRRYPNLISQVIRRTFLRTLPLCKRSVQKYEANDLDWDKPQSVDWLQSSFWLIRKSIWDEIGPLDESFFLFMADPDYCLRAKNSGYSSFYEPSLVAYADGKRASAGGFLKIFKSRALRIHVLDALKYYLKHGFI